MTSSESESAGGTPVAADNRPAQPAARQRTTAESRVEGLTPPAIRFLQAAARSLEARDFDTAAGALRQARSIAPQHPEILRFEALLEYRRGRLAEASALLRQVLAAWPDDAMALGNIGSIYADTGRTAEALLTLNRACQVAPDQAAPWFNLGKLLDSQAYVLEAEKAFANALERAPKHVPARIAHGGTLASLGRTDEAADEYRKVIAQESRSVQAWLALVNLKTLRLGEAETATLERLHADPRLADNERTVAGFALGKVLEDAGRHADAYAVLASANAMRRRVAPWDATAFSQQIDAISDAFAGEPPPPLDPSLGEPVIFVVSLPRSGSTLVEQILAAHPDVEGASELPDLETVILEESIKRQKRFPDWVADATPEDWQRLGRRYLERTARWRKQRPRFTDKMPDNWLLVGAALRMLPNARVVNVRRDAVETCWSCFKQLFAAGRHGYSYDLADLAETWRDYDRLSRAWSERFPDRVREQSYEALVADPEGEARALLAFCDLAFDPAVLRFHEAGRSVRSASAAQVREPLRADTARSAAYAGMLEPLRRMLASRDDTPDVVSDEARIAAAMQRGERVQGLDGNLAIEVLRAAALLGSGRADDAAPIVERARAAAPGHAEVLRLTGALDSIKGRHADAIAALRRADTAKPNDALILNTLGTAEAAAGEPDRALATFRRAADADARFAGARYNLGALLAARDDFEAARAAFGEAIAIDPAFAPARVALADVLRRLDRSDEAMTMLRAALAADPHSPTAWELLTELGAGELTAAERTALEDEYRRPRRSVDERAGFAYALASVLEGRAQYAEAFALFSEANALRRRGIEWDAARHTRRCDRILEAFPANTEVTSTSTLGEGCIFVLGLPDDVAAGVARVLRAHPSIGYANAPNPARLIAAETDRRQQKFVQWSRTATPADWLRLGREYLAEALPNGARSHRLFDTTALGPELAGAVASMLPAARFVAIGNDALESCWSCLRTDFHDRERYSADLAEVAQYQRDFERLLARWHARFGARIHRVDADALHDDPAGTIAALFAHCGLDAGEASASGDRLHLRARPAARVYGDLLKPLARMLDAKPAGNA
jgi:tetratricopeptide (TPR) repeat protein